MLRYQNQDGLITAQSIYKKDLNFPKTIILTWQTQFQVKLFAKFECKKYKKSLCAGGVSVVIYLFSNKEKNFAFALLPAGGPIVSMMMEELHALGAEKFLFIGSCGYIGAEKTDCLIVPSKALRDEGTSYHYIDGVEEFIDVDTWHFADKFLTDLDVPHKVGATWTTDTFYRETPNAKAEALQKGCICVEMECASIMAVAKAKQLRAYQLLFTADKLTSDGWNIGRLKNMKSDIYALYLEIILEMALQVSLL